ncbi:ABC transporter permease subunit [Kineosporia rhizophila]|uniref:ABC transporter permease n=1 Tax=Kineosporia TaxID=49184 RepID=UPI001E44E735|nr:MULTISPECIES: ABC transporter permease subunit [Kineosporia]MCE0540025.1 ABC transporter permease subunit [Kineosporia rhizophila]GLY14369.1 ABC transporter permease [Kineosporia sp. NBRC 101677]
MAAVTALVPETEKPTERGPGLRARSAKRARVTRALLMVPFALFFAVPLLALVEFSTRATDLYGERTLEAWRAIGDNPELLTALRDSLLLALLTSVVALALLVPTMVWVRLRLPKLQRVVEFLCLLPLTIPALVLVVGLGPIYLWIAYFTPDAYDSSPLVLVFVYVVLVMPYMYRSLDAGLQAIDVRTLSEAARSLGAGWFTVMVRVILPNITSAVLNASLLAVALVLGEFTVASLLNYDNLQVAINLQAQASVGVAVALSAAALAFVFVLLFALSFVGRRRSTAEEK